MLYTYSDAQGSLVALTDVDGNLVRRYDYDPWGARRDADNWNAKDNCAHLIVNRGYTGHEHLDAFGIINMNGRVYDPLTAQFFSPDPYVQAPGNWLNYNRYGYCYGNPFTYTDPSGKYIFTVLAAIFCPPLLPIAVCADIGWISGGIRGSNTPGMNFWDGAWRGAITGTVGGALSIVGGAGMSFGMNLLIGTGEGALTGRLDAALWGNNIGKGMLWGAVTAAALTTVTSENMKNLINGKGFYTNENVFNHMIDDGVNKQDILDYFGFRGTYDSSQTGPSYVEGNKSYGAYTSPKGEIFYGDNAFTSYANLKGSYYKELYTSDKILNGGTIETQNVKGEAKVYPEKRLGFIDQYKNQKLYPNNTTNIPSQIEFYQTGSGIVPWDKNYFDSNKWYNFIYKIPRRW